MWYHICIIFPRKYLKSLYDISSYPPIVQGWHITCFQAIFVREVFQYRYQFSTVWAPGGQPGARAPAVKPCLRAFTRATTKTKQESAKTDMVDMVVRRTPTTSRQSFFWTMSGRGTRNLLKNHQQQFHNRTTVVAQHSRKRCKYNWVTRSFSSNHLTRWPSERNTLLIPNKYQSEAVVRLVDSEEVMKPYYRYRDTLRMMTSSCRWYTLPLRLEAICLTHQDTKVSLSVRTKLSTAFQIACICYWDWSLVAKKVLEDDDSPEEDEERVRRKVELSCVAINGPLRYA